MNTLAQASVLVPTVKLAGTKSVSCVQVQIQSPEYKWPLLIGLIADLPVPLFLGRGRVPRQTPFLAPRKDIWLGKDKKPLGQPKVRHLAKIITLSLLCITRFPGGSFGREQKEDDC
ncbi:uncharacterized protein LOC108261586 [Tachysurus ichikawai]